MAEHGGNSDEAAKAYGFAANEMVDLSTGISPIAYDMALPSSKAFQALPLNSDLEQLLHHAKHAYGVPAGAAICAGAGSQSLLSALPKLYEPTVIWCPEPTYNEHRYRWERAGHHVDGSAHCPKEARIIILGHPNNPTGHIWSHADKDQYLAHVKAKGGLLIIDEAFADASPDISFMADADDDSIMILRSVGKFFGLAGLRVGFAIGGTKMIASLADEIGPWPLSQPAMIVAGRALQDSRWQDSHRKKLGEKSAWLAIRLQKAGFELVAHTPLFITIRHHNIAAFHDHLARHGYWTRLYANQPDMMRLGLLPDDHQTIQFESLLTGW